MKESNSPETHISLELNITPLGLNRHKQNYISPIVWPKIPLCTYNLSRHPCLESSNLFQNAYSDRIDIYCKWNKLYTFDIWLWGLCNSLPLVMLRRYMPPQVGTVRECLSTFLTVQWCVSVQLWLLKFTNYRLDLFRHQFLFSIWVKKLADCVNLFPKLFHMAKSLEKLTQLALITTCFTNWFGYFMKCDFHDSDKMPKHVEMVWTKCQPKIWGGQNANHRKKSGHNANLWLALCPVGILSGWHFVLPPNPAGYGTRNHYS